MSGLSRARRLLSRPGAWLDQESDGYGLRVGADRRGRVLLRLTEVEFRALAEAPGLRGRPGGGWRAAKTMAERASSPPPGRPGVIDGARTLMAPDGHAVRRPANLGVTPIRWLAARRAASGEPWLTPAQVAAAERLGRDAEMAASGPALTMRWDAMPHGGAGAAGSARAEPRDAALAAGRRVRLALAACGPARGMVEAVCIRFSSLQLAEQDAGLRRREGKCLLAEGLTKLVAHYRIG